MIICPLWYISQRVILNEILLKVGRLHLNKGNRILWLGRTLDNINLYLFMLLQTERELGSLNYDFPTLSHHFLSIRAIQYKFQQNGKPAYKTCFKAVGKRWHGLAAGKSGLCWTGMSGSWLTRGKKIFRERKLCREN